MHSAVQCIAHSVVAAMQFDEKGLLLLDDIQDTHFTSEKLKFNENRIYLVAMHIVSFILCFPSYSRSLLLWRFASQTNASKHKIDLFGMHGTFLVSVFALVNLFICGLWDRAQVLRIKANLSK